MIRRDGHGNIILGYSWAAPADVIEERELKSRPHMYPGQVDPRFRVCTNCVTGKDTPTVAIIGETTMPALCERCGRPISKKSL